MTLLEEMKGAALALGIDPDGDFMHSPFFEGDLWVGPGMSLYRRDDNRLVLYGRYTGGFRLEFENTDEVVRFLYRPAV